MTSNARRILAATAKHRRQRATRQWLTHFAELSDKAAGAALDELEALGYVVGRGNMYDIITPTER